MATSPQQDRYPQAACESEIALLSLYQRQLQLLTRSLERTVNIRLWSTPILSAAQQHDRDQKIHRTLGLTDYIFVTIFFSTGYKPKVNIVKVVIYDHANC